MIQHPILIFLILLTIETVVLTAAAHSRTKRYFGFLPAVFWIYFLPMCVSSLGLIDVKSPLYGVVTTYGLPASLFLLLLGVDLKAITQLGRTALLMFLAGSFGIVLGTALSFALFKGVVGAEFWSGFAALSASWTGGSANMIAVKEALGTPDDVFLPMVVVDTIVPYVWMGLLVSVSTGQAAFDHWLRADRGVIEDIRKRMAGVGAAQKVTLTAKNIFALAAFAFAVSVGVQQVARVLPTAAGIMSFSAWTIILASMTGLAGSLTPLRRCEDLGSTKIGYVLLFFVLTTIGAKASIAHLGASAVLIAAGVVIILVHAAVLLLAARLLRAPAMLVAAASQANVGGVASAPVVAEIYQPGLGSIGLLLAVLGNIIGTYLGIIVGQVCRWVTLLS
ncbi:MAG: DUF819 family protein [Candidatus Omnitrophica bacterium]|nr:DUF819 family protein [Candidatus Omnitrophota bacterium]